MLQCNCMVVGDVRAAAPGTTAAPISYDGAKIPRMVSMSEREVFPNAPITEAILDIRVTPSSDMDVSALRGMHDRIKDRFPIAEGLAGIEGEFLFERGSAQTRASVHATGFLFRSSDQTSV